ncbi:HNH endonuclease signature motif containing protein [Agromyces sp. H66]|uniref:HNH endonuclease signature motif containing protein n=1 Tax=Agromyces sp. H66 TaxID=2529859 RepID=UPI0010AABA7B|nr:HNH endonuclease signature motif containing protein [Agromyces sp. H66]
MPDLPSDLADIARRLIGREVSTGTFVPLDDAALLAAVEELTALRHEVERCQAIARATRERDAADGLVQLLRAGASVDPSRLLDERKPSVRIIVNADSLATGEGTGMIEGHPDRIPLADIHTGLCEGHLPLKFSDDGACLDLGRDERLFTERQKVALAVRDGGCMDPDCTRPPSWTEAHHIDHWHRDGGRSDLADGILLCRGDHLRYHNEGWEVRREGTEYRLIPPPGVDPERTPRLMRSKTPSDILNPVDPARLPELVAPTDRSRLASDANEREPALLAG